MTKEAAVRDAALRDEERTRCEVWTRVMGYSVPYLNSIRENRANIPNEKHLWNPLVCDYLKKRFSHSISPFRARTGKRRLISGGQVSDEYSYYPNGF